MSNINKTAEFDKFMPLNEPPIGTAYTDVVSGPDNIPSTECVLIYVAQNIYTQNKNIPLLFQPLTVRNVTFKNRIFLVSVYSITPNGR